ncbi:hypothetical protein [Marinicrinis lubricantis]|uniref:Uncharacterized protein n=1 Tax=Marinicrinis lubricantis TaxID=2086470 RepID=A0ABW1IJL3_9BACL
MALLGGFKGMVAFSAFAMTAAADSYVGEAEQMFQTVNKIQDGQQQLLSQMSEAQNEGNQALASQLHAQFEQNERNLEQIGISFAPIDLTKSKLDIETLMTMVQSQRSSMLEAQLEQQVHAVKERNEQISRLQQELIAAQQAGDEQKLSELKAKIDQLSNASQMDMIRLQSLTNKRNEAFELMTDMMRKKDAGVTIEYHRKYAMKMQVERSDRRS